MLCNLDDEPALPLIFGIKESFPPMNILLFRCDEGLKLLPDGMLTGFELEPCNNPDKKKIINIKKSMNILTYPENFP